MAGRKAAENLKLIIYSVQSYEVRDVEFDYVEISEWTRSQWYE